MLFLKTLLFLSFLFLNFSAFGTSLLEDVRYALQSIQPFRVQFVQQVFIDDQLEIEESGYILIKDISHLKWVYVKPDVKIFLMMEDSYRFYDQENNQLLIGEIGEKKQKWIWQLLFSEKIVDSITGDRQNNRILIKKEEEELDFEVFIGPTMLPMRVIQNDISGARYIYLFDNYQRNITVSPSDFQLDLPEGVEIIDGTL